MAKVKKPRWVEGGEGASELPGRKKYKKTYMYTDKMEDDMTEEPMEMCEMGEMGGMDGMHGMHPMHHMHHMPMGMMLAHAYVPWQSYEQAFSPKEALMKGTLFPELWGAYPIPE